MKVKLQNEKGWRKLKKYIGKPKPGEVIVAGYRGQHYVGVYKGNTVDIITNENFILRTKDIIIYQYDGEKK